MGQSQFQVPDRDPDSFFAEIEGQCRAGVWLTRFFSLLHIGIANPSALPVMD